jgi:hypothetical protein
MPSLYRMTAKTALGTFSCESSEDVKYAIIVRDDYLGKAPEVFKWTIAQADTREALLEAVMAGRPYERTVLLAPVGKRKYLRAL